MLGMDSADHVLTSAAWCMSDEFVIGFNQKKVFKFSSEDGDLLSIENVPKGSTQCTIIEDKIYFAGGTDQVLIRYKHLLKF